MLILGVTGSIGSGKSHFCKKLSRLRGIKVLSSDEMVHFLYEDNNFIQSLSKTFGKEIITNSKIDRQKLGKIVFKDPEKKKQLEEIVYPELAKQRQQIIKLLNRQHFRGILALEIPLLFENGLEEECDVVISVFCNPVIQKQRAFRRKDMTEEKYNNILKTQMPVHGKIKRSDLTYNSGSHQPPVINLRDLLLNDQ